ncbi:MAG: hypothetical protein AAFX05_12210 [Planctomycetota bacterium]
MSVRRLLLWCAVWLPIGVVLTYLSSWVIVSRQWRYAIDAPVVIHRGVPPQEGLRWHGWVPERWECPNFETDIRLRGITLTSQFRLEEMGDDGARVFLRLESAAGWPVRSVRTVALRTFVQDDTWGPVTSAQPREPGLHGRVARGIGAHGDGFDVGPELRSLPLVPMWTIVVNAAVWGFGMWLVGQLVLIAGRGGRNLFRDGQRARSKRVLAVACVSISLLTMGAFVSVIVAWGAATWGTAGKDRDPWVVWPGFPCGVTHSGLPAPMEECRLQLHEVTFAAEVRAGRVFEFGGMDGAWRQVWILTFGWPLRSMSFTDHAWQSGGFSPTYEFEQAWSLEIPRGLHPVDPNNRIPLRVLWPGMIVNSVLFALMFASPLIVRRELRRRRGGCGSCGYDVAGVARCPECGRDV